MKIKWQNSLMEHRIPRWRLGLDAGDFSLSRGLGTQPQMALALRGHLFIKLLV